MKDELLFYFLNILWLYVFKSLVIRYIIDKMVR